MFQHCLLVFVLLGTTAGRNRDGCSGPQCEIITVTTPEATSPLNNGRPTGAVVRTTYKLPPTPAPTPTTQVYTGTGIIDQDNDVPGEVVSTPVASSTVRLNQGRNLTAYTVVPRDTTASTAHAPTSFGSDKDREDIPVIDRTVPLPATMDAKYYGRDESLTPHPIITVPATTTTATTTTTTATTATTTSSSTTLQLESLRTTPAMRDSGGSGGSIGIVAGAVGCVALLLLLLAGFFWRMRQKRKTGAKIDYLSQQPQEPVYYTNPMNDGRLSSSGAAHQGGRRGELFSDDEIEDIGYLDFDPDDEREDLSESSVDYEEPTPIHALSSAISNAATGAINAAVVSGARGNMSGTAGTSVYETEFSMLKVRESPNYANYEEASGQQTPSDGYAQTRSEGLDGPIHIPGYSEPKALDRILPYAEPKAAASQCTEESHYYSHIPEGNDMNQQEYAVFQDVPKDHSFAEGNDQLANDVVRIGRDRYAVFQNILRSSPYSNNSQGDAAYEYEEPLRVVDNGNTGQHYVEPVRIMNSTDEQHYVEPVRAEYGSLSSQHHIYEPGTDQ